MIFIISKDGERLSPSKRFRAVKRWLKEGKAKVIRREPFVVQLLFDHSKQNEPRLRNIVAIDTGFKTSGFALVNERGECLYASEVINRTDVTKKMKDRAMYRRNRRNRKTRYRPARFNNRKNSKREDRYPPTITSIFGSIVSEIDMLEKYIHIDDIVIEKGHFDNHKIANPEVWGTGYQKGINYGYANSREHALHRDGYTCQVCKKNKCRLEVHHILERCKGGSDEVDNLITLCETCHRKVHNKEIDLKKKGKKKTKQKPATIMNIVSNMLFKKYPNAIKTYGYITKANRQSLGLPKMHCTDAMVMASGGKEVKPPEFIYKKRLVASGTRQMIRFRNKGYDKIERKVCGHYMHEKAEYFGKVGFIGSRNKKGYCILKDINGNKIDFSYLGHGLKTPKFKDLKIIQKRKTTLTIKEKIVI